MAGIQSDPCDRALRTVAADRNRLDEMDGTCSAAATSASCRAERRGSRLLRARSSSTRDRSGTRLRARDSASTGTDGSGTGRRTALLFHLAPQFFDPRTQLAVRCAARTSPGTHHDVHRGELVLMQPEGFAHHAPNSIALNGTAGHLRGDREPETGTTLIVQSRSHTEEPVSHAPAARVHRIEVRLPPQAPLRGKSESLGMRAAVSQWPCASARRSATSGDSPDSRG
jgi:hypothetical protein